MAKQKMSVSEKIRKQLAQGKSVKEISKYLKCSPALVYQVRAYDKKKDEKLWKSAGVVTSSTSIVKQRQEQMRNDALNALAAAKPGAIRYGETVFVPTTPKDYAVPKRNIVQRFFNWICGG